MLARRLVDFSRALLLADEPWGVAVDCPGEGVDGNHHHDGDGVFEPDVFINNTVVNKAVEQNFSEADEVVLHTKIHDAAHSHKLYYSLMTKFCGKPFCYA